MHKPATNLTVTDHQIERRVFRVLFTWIVVVGLAGLVVFGVGCLLLFSLL